MPLRVDSGDRPHQAVAELMAECPSCGAITSFALELAWQLDVVSCSECNRAMRLDEVDLDGFRERLEDAIARVEALQNGPPTEVSYLSVGAATVALQQTTQERSGGTAAHADVPRQPDVP